MAQGTLYACRYSSRIRSIAIYDEPDPEDFETEPLPPRKTWPFVIVALLILFAMLANTTTRGREWFVYRNTSCADIVRELTPAPTGPKNVVYIVDSNCRERTLHAIGTGWVASGGNVVTARHVVDVKNSPDTWIITHDKVIRVKTIQRSAQTDLALLTPEKSLHLASFTIGADPVIGNTYHAYGHTDHDGTGQATLVMDDSFMQNGFMADEYQGNVYPGWSGGPILNKANEIVGVTYAKNQVDPYAYGIPASSLAEFGLK